MVNSEYLLTVIGLVKILLLMVLMNHYLACCWFLISVNMQDQYDTWTAVSFGPRDAEPIVGLDYAYSTSLHWSLTQFTPASMEVTPKNYAERLFNVFIILLAMVYFSSFISSIQQAMMHIRNMNKWKEEREALIRTYFMNNKIT